MLLLKAFLLCIALKCVFGRPANVEPPKWSDTYSLTGVLYLPYAEIEEPFQAWYDGPNKRSRIDYYGGNVRSIDYELFL